MDETAAIALIEQEVETLRSFWMKRRDRVFLAGAQAALDKHAGVRLNVPGAHALLRPGDEIYQDDLDKIEADVSRVIEGWKHHSELAFRTIQKFIDEWSPGVYVVALTPETLPVQVKVGRTEYLHTRVLPIYRRICPTLRLLQHIPATQFSGTLLATERDLIRRGTDRLHYIGGEVFHARDLAAAVTFADDARRHYIGS